MLEWIQEKDPGEEEFHQAVKEVIDTDVPEGNMGVGAREIGYLFGMYRKSQNEFTGMITGKSRGWGGSLIRAQAPGYGLVYFAAEMLATRNDRLEGKTCLISGSGNVAQSTAEKLIELGGKVITFSDSSGYIYDEEGIDRKKLTYIKRLKLIMKRIHGACLDAANEYGSPGNYRAGANIVGFVRVVNAILDQGVI
jgi:glutamate dehydrogenase (NADP+)